MSTSPTNKSDKPFRNYNAELKWVVKSKAATSPLKTANFSLLLRSSYFALRWDTCAPPSSHSVCCLHSLLPLAQQMRCRVLVPLKSPSPQASTSSTDPPMLTLPTCSLMFLRKMVSEHAGKTGLSSFDHLFEWSANQRAPFQVSCLVLSLTSFLALRMTAKSLSGLLPLEGACTTASTHLTSSKT